MVVSISVLLVLDDRVLDGKVLDGWLLGCADESNVTSVDVDAAVDSSIVVVSGSAELEAGSSVVATDSAEEADALSVVPDSWLADS